MGKYVGIKMSSEHKIATVFMDSLKVDTSYAS